MRRVWLRVKAAKLLTQCWHFIFALNYNDKGLKMNSVPRWMVLKYTHGKQTQQHYIHIYMYACICKIQHYIFHLLEIYVSLDAVSDCQSRLYAILLFWFGWMKNVTKPFESSYISIVSIIHNGCSISCIKPI